MKRYIVIVTYPDAPASVAQMEFREDASSPALAVKRAMQKASWQLRRNSKHRSLDFRGKVTWQCVGSVKKLEEAAAQVDKPVNVEATSQSDYSKQVV